MAESKKKAPFLMYKGRPLVRKGNTLYYGSMAEPFVIMMQITSTKKVKELEVANKVTVQLMNTDPDVRPRERIVKKAKRMVYTMRWTSAPSGWIARCKKAKSRATQRSGAYPWENQTGRYGNWPGRPVFCSFSPAEYFVTQFIMIAHRLSF